MEKSTQKKAEREFLICDYVADSSGRMRCAKPASLPCGGDGEPCRVWIHDWRQRGSGPEYQLMVVYCKTHGRYFTVYPPGWAPCQRAPVAPQGSAGDGPEAWTETLFESAVSDRWLGHYEFDGKTNWRTHRRRLVRYGELLGLSKSFALGEEVAALLELPLHVHVAARKQFARGNLHWQRRAVCRVLETIPVTARLWRQMVRAGCAAGAWGTPWYWTPGGVLERVFCGAEPAAVSSLEAGAGSDP